MAVAPLNNIVLIGFMGSGKTTVGKLLARKFLLQFLDLDRRIAAQAKLDIREIIARGGESAFRALETRELRQTAQISHRRVIETGAGVVTQAANFDLLRSLGWVIYLHTEPDELFRRYSLDSARPMLKTPEASARFAKLFTEREPLYARTAHTVVKTTGQSPGKVADLLHAALQKAGARQAPTRPAAADSDGHGGPKAGDFLDAAFNIFDLLS